MNKWEKNADKIFCYSRTSSPIYKWIWNSESELLWRNIYELLIFASSFSFVRTLFINFIPRINKCTQCRTHFLITQCTYNAMRVYAFTVMSIMYIFFILCWFASHVYEISKEKEEDCALYNNDMRWIYTQIWEELHNIIKSLVDVNVNIKLRVL